MSQQNSSGQLLGSGLSSDGVSSRRVLSRDAAIHLGQRLLALVQDESLSVRIEHTARAVTKVANGRLLHTDDGDDVRISFQSRFGVGLPVTISTNQLNDEMLRQVVARAESMLPPKSSADPVAPENLDSPDRYTYNSREFPPVALWHDSTARAMETARADVIPTLIEGLHSAQLTGAATVGFAARAELYLYKYGLTAFAEETDCEVTVTARTPDGTGSGWGGQAHRDWAQVSPKAAVDHAVEIAHLSRNPVAFEPGRRTAILGPAAVAQLVRGMAYAFDGVRVREPGHNPTPFAIRNDGTQGRHTKLGQRVFDPRIVMLSDPADPLGGYPPFFEEGNWVEFIVLGFPTPAMRWIDAGRLENLANRVSEAMKRNLPTSNIPQSVRLATVPGTQLASIPEMIANCSEGIYINRFSEVNVVDERSGMMTGTTRDGCFLIRKGKIEKSIKNFRFTESPFYAFNNVEMIGATERVAFGYTNTPSGWDWRRWPRLPIIVPPMMVRDFNFSALSDAV